MVELMFSSYSEEVCHKEGRKVKIQKEDVRYTSSFTILLKNYSNQVASP